MKKAYNGMEVAVIGMAGKFPGADNHLKYWENLVRGVEGISFFTDEELLENGERKSNLSNPDFVKANSYLEDKENFDASFFGYVPDEASLMDPQMRVFHECVWSAMEDAGYFMSEYEDKIGVFAGGSDNVNWQNYAAMENMNKNKVPHFSLGHLSHIKYLCTRLSYLFDLSGPSIYVDTACSTSLVAIQRAAMSLLLGECSMAIAGGVCVGNLSKNGYLYQEGIIYSKDGHCRAFDANASGTIGGEGAGVVVLKRLKDAMADKDNIHAIIRGSAVNNDGRKKVGYTAPSVIGQYQAHLKARKMANIPAESISYIEAHGTGTPLGDPIEIEALTLAYGKSEKKYCALGSVKTNIGHLDAAAGVAGFIKTVLSLKHRQLPASLHFEWPNPKINFDSSPFYVNTELKNWKVDGYPLRAGVSSFGIGGTNAHVILEEAPEVSSTPSTRTYHLLKLSGKTSGALQRNAQHLLEYLEREAGESLSDIAYTLNTGRESFAYRKVLVCKDREETIGQLRELQGSRGTKGLSEKTNYKVVFMFPGQGSQHVNMCRDLYDREPAFRKTLDQCFEIIKKLSGRDLKQVVFTAGPSAIDELENALPMLFSFEYSLARLLMSWGIQPDSMIGHSNAEYIAACLSGLLSLESALGLIVRRGELMQQMPSGKMLSVSISSESLQPYLAQAPEIAFAAHNSATSCVVSGPPKSVDAFQALLEGADIITKPVRSSHAGHSQMMEGMLESYREALESVTFSEMHTPFVSNYAGKEATYEEVSKPDYWLKHLRHTVKFSEGIGELMNWDHVLFVEVGPGKTLGSFVGAHQLKGRGHQVVNMLGHPKEEENDFKRVFEGLGKLWLHGHQPDWSTFYVNEERKKVSLPTYSFEKEKYPANVDATKMIMEMMSVVQRPLNTSLSECLYVPSWESSVLIKDERRVAEKREYLTLFFCDHTWKELADGLLSSLTASDKTDTVVVVRKGSSFEQTETYFTIDPEERSHYDRLLTSIDREGKEVRILFGWGLSVAEPLMHVDAYQKRLGESYFSLLDLTRSVSEWVGKDKVEFTTLTHRLHQVLGKEPVLADQSPLLGAVKMIPKEYENISCRNIDISDLDGGEELLSSLMDELHHSDGEQLVSYRYGTRFTPSLRQKRVGLTADEELSFVAGSTYLITGGLGGVGLTYADQLSEEIPDVKLILLGRKVLPPKSDWTEWLTFNKENREEDPQYRIIATLLKIEERGTTLNYVSVDLTDAAALTSEITQITKKTGPIRGVIHTAGIGDFAGVIHKRSREDCEEIFSSKVYGTLALTTALEEEELDFMVYCSSFSSVSAPFGQVGYVAANLFLESFARSQSLVHQGKVISIGWNQWSEVGIAAREIAAKRFSLSEDSITPKEGYDLLKRSLKLNRPVVFITRYDPMANRDQPQAVVSLSPSSEDTAPEESSIKELTMNSYSDLETGLLELWQSFFGKTDLEVEDDFFEIGGDSLKALTMTRRINMHFQVDISLVDFFKYSTIESLASYLSNQEGQKHESIAKAEEQPYYRLSSAQRRLYFLYEFDRTSLAYNLPQVVRFEGKLDQEQLREAFRKLVDRHEALRTSFEMVGEEVVQRIHKDCELDIAYCEAKESEVSALVKEFIRPFDLSKAPFRLGLIRVSEADHVLMVDTHHIVSDGTSQGILIGDFMRLYQGAELTKLSLQYKDYSQWQGSEAYQSGLSAQRDYWQGVFAEPVEAMELPTDHPRPKLMEHCGGKLGFMLEVGETTALKQLTREEGTTMFMVLLSALNVLLSKLSNQEDIVIGTPTAGRNHTDLEEMIGMFVNTMVLRNKVEGKKTFKTFLQEVKERTLTAFDNQDYQYEELIDLLNVSREPNRNPLFDVMFVFQNFDTQELKVPDISLKGYPVVHEISKFDLTFFVVELAESLSIELEFSTELFNKDTAKRLLRYLKEVLRSVIADHSVALSEIELLSEQDQSTLLNQFNSLDIGYPTTETLVSLFEEQVKQQGDRTVLIDGNKTVSYHDLNVRSNQLAGYLKDKGVATGSIVGLLLDDPMQQVISILGVLKASGCYLPIDTTQPDERIGYMLNDSACEIILTTATQASSGRQLLEGRQVVLVSDDQVQTYSGENLTYEAASSDLAYIIYTSGTTGRPKGAMVEHRQVVRLFFNESPIFNFGPSDVWTLFHSYSFDFSVWEMYGALLHGGKLVLLSREVARDPSMYHQLLVEHGVTILNQTPTAFQNLQTEDQLKEDTSLHVRKVIFGGEKLIPGAIKSWQEKYPDTEMINMYGITETTVHVTYKLLKAEDISSSVSNIGKPIPTTQVYVLDDHGKLTLPCVKGELYVGGDGVCRGYLNNSELTEEKFIPNPYEPGGRLYRTGDAGRWLPNGELEYLGRIDNQVQFRGYRIELGEIETHLLTHAGVKEAVVTSRGEGTDVDLVGYYVSAEELSVNTLRNHLSLQLPSYMIPAYFVHLDRMPLTGNGKLDLRALQEPEATAQEAYIAPRNEIEEQLVQIWIAVLKVEKVGINDNYFALGGDSIKVINIVSQINNAFNADITIADVFAHQTIEQIALLIPDQSSETSEDNLRDEVLDEFAALKDKVLNHG